MELGQVPLLFSRVPMFPFFDLAHYVVSVTALKEQRGAVEVSIRSPVASWFSAMLCCFGGSVLSSLMLGEPPVAFLAKTTNILLASSVWYLVFYCPQDKFCQCFAFLPLRLLVAGMKEVTRTWKIVAGVAHADSYFEDAWLVMIAVGWARGAGSNLISNFEQLVRGVWKPETNELLKMSYPRIPNGKKSIKIMAKQWLEVVGKHYGGTRSSIQNEKPVVPQINGYSSVIKGTALVQRLRIGLYPAFSCSVKVTLIGAVLFTLQHSQYLPIARHNLMFLYTIFLVVSKVTMMLTRSTASPFVPIEAMLGHMFSGLQKQPSKVKGEGASSSSCSSVCDQSSPEQPCDGVKKRQAKKTE